MTTFYSFRFFRKLTIGASVSLLAACGAGNDDGGSGGSGNGSGGSGAGGASTTTSCGDVCDELATRPGCAEAGITAAVCEQACSGTACASCLSRSASCGSDCEAECAEGGGTGGSSNDDPPECIRDDECGISFECVSCGLNDGEGWCEQTSSCNFDEDCGIDGECGYSVESGDYRCLPRAHCP